VCRHSIAGVFLVVNLLIPGVQMPINTYIMNFLQFVSDVGFPIAGAVASGIFIFIILKFILATVTGSVHGLKAIIQALDNRVQTMNNDLIKIDALLSHVEGVRPNVDRLAANEGKEDARKD